ncbi:hypothetical protein [Curtobacterium ammoniigenes]|uniref:hypothetical protein n=1 Tax=Curtobacterium ammoniigenes TaxID=395387 RepID=UPI0008309389|nr:hypothetical protein [Curtobacterium ammoniigenes]
MSTNLAVDLRSVRAHAEPSPLPGSPERRRPDLIEVTPTRAQRRARPRILAAAIAVGSLGILLLAQLGISMMLSQGAYTLSALTAQQTQLTQSQQALDEQLSVLESPQNLARNAQALGMIANTTPVYLDPKTGQVFGTPTPAKASDSTASQPNQVANSLLDGVNVVAKPGATATSKEQASAAGAATPADATTASGAAQSAPSATTTGAGSNAVNTAEPGAPSAASANSSVASNPNELQAPSTR